MWKCRKAVRWVAEHGAMEIVLEICKRGLIPIAVGLPGFIMALYETAPWLFVIVVTGMATIASVIVNKIHQRDMKKREDRLNQVDQQLFDAIKTDSRLAEKRSAFDALRLVDIARDLCDTVEEHGRQLDGIGDRLARIEGRLARLEGDSQDFDDPHAD